MAMSASSAWECHRMLENASQCLGKCLRMPKLENIENIENAENASLAWECLRMKANAGECLTMHQECLRMLGNTWDYYGNASERYWECSRMLENMPENVSECLRMLKLENIQGCLRIFGNANESLGMLQNDIENAWKMNLGMLENAGLRCIGMLWNAIENCFTEWQWEAGVLSEC